MVLTLLALPPLVQGCMDGCSTIGRPRPTTMPVTPQHVIGSWTYDGHDASIEIRADGTFHQRSPSKDRKSTHDQDGQWTLDGPRIEFRPFYFHDWRFEEEHWPDRPGSFYVTDFRGPELQIFGGGSPDPASWTIWNRVEPLNSK